MIANLFPAIHFMDMIRGVVLRDATFADLGSGALVLSLYSIFGIATASLRFKKSLE
ncbi:hypothetical protein [Shimia haliotis]|uniref:ABC-2 type transport system permease protein n=1 Tax=Shimia haliotis TaxID=1280847 RepID=A0A1I4HMR3_9RHOB|nr:hypothetical protein [Shimia haliotis]SFL42811.1 ABC-2 type transport system permease protein [Shimia haliotis]